MDLVGIVELEVDVLDDEGPDVIAEAVSVEVTLCTTPSVCRRPLCCMRPTDLEGETRFDLVAEHVGNSLVKVEKDLHGELGLDPALGDELVECIGEGATQTTRSARAPRGDGFQAHSYLLRRYSS